jgi:broad specificity phosphatase PhoE
MTCAGSAEIVVTPEAVMAPKRVVLLRHGEKPGGAAAPDDPAQPHLAPAGVERAKMLAALIPAKFGTPDYLIAAKDSDQSHRPVETLQPLATALQFGDDKFIKSFKNAEYPALATALLSDARYSGLLVIVCWHHGNIPELGLALDMTEAQLATAPEIAFHQGRPKWDATVFDKFWVIDFVAGQPGVAFQSIEQKP